MKTVGIFIFMNFFTRIVLPQVMGPKASSVDPANPSAAVSTAPIPSFTDRPTEITGQYNPVPQSIAPLWPLDTSLDIKLYVSPSMVMPSLRSMPKDSLVMHEQQLRFGNWSEAREVHASFTVPKETQRDGTLWGHFYVAQSGAEMDPTAPYFDSTKAYHFVKPLTQYLPKKKVRKTRNLLDSKPTPEEEAEELEEASAPAEMASYYHPNFTLSLVPDASVMSYAQLHPASREFVQLESTGARDESGQNAWYYPVLYLNTFWQLRTHMTELNSTVKTLPLNFHINSLSYWKFNILTSMDFGVKQNMAKAAAGEKIQGAADGSDFEMIKTIILDSNIYLLTTTVFVGILHMLFEMLAFKNDLSHWRNKKDNVGVSVRTILANVFMQGVIFLYLLDNNENTSWMILFSQGMGIALEAWKITKTVDVRLRPTAADEMAFPWRYFPYTVVFEDKHKLSETEKKTQEYDAIAFKYMYWVAVPLELAYAAYSLKYESHKGWYSFIIAVLVGSVYAYGFLLMIPSLYINYRLKSVAHMPGKAMTYKFLNTIVDDLVSFAPAALRRAFRFHAD